MCKRVIQQESLLFGYKFVQQITLIVNIKNLSEERDFAASWDLRGPVVEWVLTGIAPTLEGGGGGGSLGDGAPLEGGAPLKGGSPSVLYSPLVSSFNLPACSTSCGFCSMSLA